MSHLQHAQNTSNANLTDYNIELVAAKLKELRLLGSTRQNPPINIRSTPASTSFIRIVNELRDILHHNLSQSRRMRLLALPSRDAVQ